MLIDISKVVVNDRIRKEFGDIAELATDIEENGLINPPVVSPEMVLIAGERRLRACKHLGWQQIEVRVISVKDYEHQLKLEISENQKRKNFTFSEGLEWARRLEQVEKLKARERKESTQIHKQNAVGENFPAPEEHGRASDIVAAEAGFGSGKTYEKAKFIADHADAETIARLDAEETSIHAEYVRLKSKEADSAKEIQRQAVLIQKLRDDLDQSQTAQKILRDMKKPDAIEKRVEVIPEEVKKTIAKQKAEIEMLQLELDCKKSTGDTRDDFLMKASFFTTKIRDFVRTFATTGYLGSDFARLSPQGQKDYEAAISSLEKLCRDLRDQAIIPKESQIYEVEAKGL